MKKTTLFMPSFTLVGISCRTKTLLEWNPKTARILPTIQRYFESGLFGKISHRETPGVTYCAYTNYESDIHGEYTFFIGEMVLDSHQQEETLEVLSIPRQQYVKFTTDSGSMPIVSIEAWKEIWGMSSKELGAERNYITDFELYDERSRDPSNTILDIYVGIK